MFGQVSWQAEQRGRYGVNASCREGTQSQHIEVELHALIGIKGGRGCCDAALFVDGGRDSGDSDRRETDGEDDACGRFEGDAQHEGSLAAIRRLQHRDGCLRRR